MVTVCLILVIVVTLLAGPKICNYFELGLGGVMVCLIIIELCAVFLFYLITGTEPGSL